MPDIKYYIGTTNESIDASDAVSIDLKVAPIKLASVQTDDFIGFINPKNECIQFVNLDNGKWLIDHPILNDKGVYDYTLEDDNLTVEAVAEIVSLFFEGKDWRSLRNLSKNIY